MKHISLAWISQKDNEAGMWLGNWPGFPRNGMCDLAVIR